MVVRAPSLSAQARCAAVAASAAINFAILAAIAVGFAGGDEAPPPRTAGLRGGGCATHRSDAAHVALSLRQSRTKGDPPCHAS